MAATVKPRSVGSVLEHVFTHQNPSTGSLPPEQMAWVVFEHGTAFKDATNGELTYEGGRYIDCITDDIFEGKMVLDFNKCYNPYCAYSGGFACPVPPRENFIVAFIPAGEQKPAFEH